MSIPIVPQVSSLQGDILEGIYLVLWDSLRYFSVIDSAVPLQLKAWVCYINQWVCLLVITNEEFKHLIIFIRCYNPYYK